MSDSDVLIIMGSQSDWETMKHATTVLKALNIAHDVQIVSAHRTPDRLYETAKSVQTGKTKVVIAGAGGAAHLPGMFAALCPKPVVAVPVSSKHLKGMDSLLSIAQMPRGVCVATQAIGEAGAFNAGLMAAQMLAIDNQPLQTALIAWRKAQTEGVAREVSQ